MALERAQSMVARLQAELIRCCYLLTGDADLANSLAVFVFQEFFSETEDHDQVDARTQILTLVGRRFLSDDLQREDDGASSDFQEPEGERERLLAVLEWLEPRDRVALVLRDYDQLGEEQVARLIDETPYGLRARLEPARQRVRGAASVPEHISMRRLLDIAAGGAPRPVLWPLVEGPLEERERARLRRRRLIAWAITGVGTLVLVLGSVWLVAGFGWLPGGSDEVEAKLVPPTTVPRPTSPPPEPTLSPTPSPTPVLDMTELGIPEANLSSGLRIQTWAYSQTGRNNKQASFRYGVVSGELDLMESESLEVIRRLTSPDGRKVMHVMRRPNQGPSWVQMVGIASGDELWRSETSWIGGPNQFAFADGRLVELEQDGSAELIAYDVETGEELASKSGMLDEILPDAPENIVADAQISYDSYARLFATPGGDELWVWVEESWSEGGPASAQGVALASFDPVDLRVTASWSRLIEAEDDNNAQLPRQYRAYDAFWTPDGAYLVTVGSLADQLYFLSPAQSEPIGLKIPFSPRTGSNTFGLEYTVSNSGRYLYVLAAFRREIAVVDLLAREVVLAASIDSNGYSLESSYAAQTYNLPLTMLLSPDGTRLYVANAWLPAGYSPDDPRSKPVTVLDTTTWRVLDQWEVPGQLLGLIPIDGGEKIVAEYIVWEDGRFDANDERGILVLDAETGELTSRRTALEMGLPEWAERVSVTSLFGTYRQAYNRSPTLDGVEYVDAETVSSLPLMAVEVDPPRAVVGVPARIEARVLDPRGGEPLTGSESWVRFDPSSTVSVTLRHGDDEVYDVIVVLRRDSDGVYRGAVTLEASGNWDAIVTVVPPEKDARSITLPGAVSVNESLEGSDGRLYVLVAETSAEAPKANEPVTFTVQAVDARTLETIAEDVELEGGLPDEIDLLLQLGGGFTTVSLEPVEYGVYRGKGEFWSAGRWTLQIRYQSPETRRYVYFEAGSLTVEPSISP